MTILLSILFFASLSFSFAAIMEILEYFINKEPSKQYGALIAIFLWTIFYYFLNK